MDGEERRHERITLVVISTLAGLALVSHFVAFAYYYHSRSKLSRLHRRNNHGCKNENVEKMEHGNRSVVAGGSEEVQVVVGEKTGVQVFNYKQLHSATGGFGKRNVIGHGSFGSVYRGVLPDGRKIAVKLMDQAGKQGEEEFKMEVELLTRLRSLLGLIGCCSDGNHMLLVYEFSCNLYNIYWDNGLVVLPGD